MMISVFGFCQVEHHETFYTLKNIPDSLKVESNLTTSLDLLKKNPRHALFYAKEALGHAKTIGTKLDQAKCFHQIGHVLYEMGEYESALDAYNSALEIYRKSHDVDGVFNTLICNGNVYRNKSELDKARQYFSRALEFAIHEDNKYFMAEGHYSLGNLSQYEGNQIDALRSFIEAAALYNKSDNVIKMSMVDSHIGLIYKSQLEYEQALIYLENSTKRLAKLNRAELAIDNLFHMSDIHLNLGNTDMAFRQLRRADLITKNISDAGGQLRTLLKFTDNYVKIDDYENAIYYAGEALKLAEKSDNRGEMADVYSQLAITYRRSGKFKESLKYFKEAEAIINDMENYELKFGLYQDMALAYQATKNYTKALNYAKLSLELAYKINVNERIFDALNTIFEIHKQRHSYAEAFLYLEPLMAYKDSIQSSAQAIKIGELQARNQAENERQALALEQRHKDYLAEKEFSKQENIKNFFIACFLFVLIVAILIFRNFKRKSKANQLLRKKNKEILFHQSELSIQKDQLSELNKEIESQKERISIQNKVLSHKNSELEKINNEKDSLLSIVAHDLRAPLNKSKGLAELIRMDGPLNKSQLKYLTMMVNVCNEGMDIAEDLLCLHSAEQSTMKLTRTQICFNKFFDQLLQGYQDKLLKKDLKLHFTPLDSDFPIITDTNYLTRIIDNLLSNAIKFTYPGKNIFIRLEDLDKSIYVSIKDEGQGISKEEQERMFKKFQRLSAIPTAGENSTGLGLSIVHKLTEKLGGKIQVNSEVGVGTEFIIEFGKNTNAKCEDQAEKPAVSNHHKVDKIS